MPTDNNAQEILDCPTKWTGKWTCAGSRWIPSRKKKTASSSRVHYDAIFRWTRLASVTPLSIGKPSITAYLTNLEPWRTNGASNGNPREQKKRMKEEACARDRLTIIIWIRGVVPRHPATRLTLGDLNISSINPRTLLCIRWTRGYQPRAVTRSISTPSDRYRSQLLVDTISQRNVKRVANEKAAELYVEFRNSFHQGTNVSARLTLNCTSRALF